MVKHLRPSSLSRTLALIPPAVALVAQHAGADIFLKIETGGSPSTIPGESTDKVHSGWIDATSFSFGVSNAPNLSGGVISGTKAVARELTITKSLDKASPKLFLGCAMGTIFPTVTMELQQLTSGGAPVIYYKMILSNVLVSNLATSGAADRPSESISLSYQKIDIEYFIVDAKGTTTTTGHAVWDFAAATK